MISQLGDYYYDGTSFYLANVLCTDDALLIVAADGWYSQGGIYRQMLSGILNSPITCPSCVYGCDSPAINSNQFGQHVATVDIGTATGAVIIEFTVASPLNAARATWTWGGTSASEYSSPNFGYCEGLIGDENLAGIDNASGSGGVNYTGNEYIYTAGIWTLGGTSTWGPYSSEASGGVSLQPAGGYGTVIMVVPKTSTSPDTLQVSIDTTSITNSNQFSLKVNCPVQLPSFAGYSTYSTSGCTPVCSYVDPDDDVYYHAMVSSFSSAGNPAVNDWVFSDANGANMLVNAYYRVTIAGIQQCMEVVDGVITSITPC